MHKRILGLWGATAAGCLSIASAASAQTLGDVGAAGAISSGMNAQSNAGTMAVGNRMKQDARRYGSSPMMGGANAANFEGSGPDGAGGYGGPSGSGGPAGYGEGGNPEFPNPSGAGGAAAPRREPLRWSTDSGEDMIQELLRPGGTVSGGVARRGRPSSRVTSAQARRLARMTRAQRSRMIASKYKKPPVGYLSFYLPQDRFKVTSAVWKFVSIEDDRGRYPVRYYYRPNAPSFLRILAATPRNSQARYNRVIGFHTWQDAILAGYRPDPVSKPEPGAQIAYLARIARGPELARYVEFLYAGQITPESFRQNIAYIRRVERVVVRAKHTRPLLGRTVSQILAANLGDGPLPRTVGGAPRRAQIAPMQPGAIEGGSEGGPPPGYGSGSSSGSGYPGGSPSGPPPGYGSSGSSGPPPGYGSGSPSGSSGYPGGSSGGYGSSGRSAP